MYVRGGRGRSPQSAAPLRRATGSAFLEVIVAMALATATLAFGAAVTASQFQVLATQRLEMDRDAMRATAHQRLVRELATTRAVEIQAQDGSLLFPGDLLAPRGQTPTWRRAVAYVLDGAVLRRGAREWDWTQGAPCAPLAPGCEGWALVTVADGLSGFAAQYSEALRLVRVDLLYSDGGPYALSVAPRQ